MNIIVTGYAGHGKDTVCDILRDSYLFTFVSSSVAAMEIVVYPVLKDKYGYKTIEECYEDRVNHRAEWFDLIAEYNAEDGSRLGKAIFAKSQIYCGLRNDFEYNGMKEKGMIDALVWVDASNRLPPEPKESMKLSRHHADYILDNNGTKEDLIERVFDLAAFLHERIK